MDDLGECGCCSSAPWSGIFRGIFAGKGRCAQTEETGFVHAGHRGGVESPFLSTRTSNGLNSEKGILLARIMFEGREKLQKHP